MLILRILLPIILSSFMAVAATSANACNDLSGGPQDPYHNTHAAFYDPEADVWTNGGDLRGIGFFSASTSRLPSGDFFVSGCGATYIYSPSAKHWTNIPHPVDEKNRTLSTNGIVLIDEKTAFLTGQYENRRGTAYDIEKHSWIQLSKMRHRRGEVESIKLDDGRILVYGGGVYGRNIPAGVEVYNPATDKWKNVRAPFRGNSACRYAMTRLITGEILILGGTSDGGCWGASTRTGMIFDPLTNHIRLSAPMPIPRQSFTATTLLDGLVLVAGGSTAGGPALESDLYDPRTNTWTKVGSTAFHHSATDYHAIDSKGRVFLIGDASYKSSAPRVVEMYDPGTQTWSIRTPMPFVNRDTVVDLLSDGRFLVLGRY
jgi:N-acetylneuraminic acid mutarotase